MSTRTFRIGQMVPSSNTTMETEIPAMLRAREALRPERFTFHSSRMRMRKVTKEELAAMDDQSDRCATELADARVDVMGNACLVALMSRSRGYHRQSEERLARVAAESGHAIPIVSSAGALIEGLHAIGAKRISVITPYLRPLTELVLDYIRAEGIEVIDSISLEIADNLAVGARDPLALADIVQDLKIAGADAIVLSACVQCPRSPRFRLSRRAFRFRCSRPRSPPLGACSRCSGSSRSCPMPVRCCRATTRKVPSLHGVAVTHSRRRW